MKQLLRNADYILTLDEGRRVLRNASVVIEGTTIIDVGDTATIDEQHRNSVSPEHIIDLSGSLLAPGFINTHAHTMEHLSRGLIPDNLPTLPWALHSRCSSCARGMTTPPGGRGSWATTSIPCRWAR